MPSGSLGSTTGYRNLSVSAVCLRGTFIRKTGDPGLECKQVLTLYNCWFTSFMSKMKTNAFSPLACFNTPCGLGGLTGGNSGSEHLTCKSAVMMEKLNNNKTPNSEGWVKGQDTGTPPGLETAVYKPEFFSPRPGRYLKVIAQRSGHRRQTPKEGVGQGLRVGRTETQEAGEVSQQRW